MPCLSLWLIYTITSTTDKAIALDLISHGIINVALSDYNQRGSCFMVWPMGIRNELIFIKHTICIYQKSVLQTHSWPHFLTNFHWCYLIFLYHLITHIHPDLFFYLPDFNATLLYLLRIPHNSNIHYKGLN